MRIDEITRRGFLKGALGAAVAGIGGAPTMAAAAPWQDLELFKHLYPEIYKIQWVPRIADLKKRCTALMSRITSILRKSPEWSKYSKMANTKLYVGPLEGHAGVDNNLIAIDVSVFWDAPDSVLAFVIAHEYGHIAYRHLESGKISPALSRKQEYEADLFAINVCKSLGYNAVEFFTFIHDLKSKRDRIEQQMRDEKIEADPTASHPSSRQRMERAKQYGFQLSRGGIEQLNTLSQHLYRATQSA